MKRSTDRILTTHAGSLPRPPDLFATFAGSMEIHPSIVWAKLGALAEGARIASRRLWGS
jgi:5-methyltetrahydropteroyltriglutamate--homocysteine methyltransferase